MSWDEGFSRRYDEWAAHMTEDVAFYVELARQADGPLVELAVGNGRVAIPVARATGREVIGLDTSPVMLDQARMRALDAGVALDLRETDMRGLALDEPAGLIYCPFRALLHLPTWADRRRTFERVAACLRPGGRFAWNGFAFDHQIAARLDGAHQQEPIPHQVRYSVGENRIDLQLDDGATSSLWWATKNEWLGLIDVSGLELESLFGGFNGEPFSDESLEYVFVARRPVRDRVTVEIVEADRDWAREFERIADELGEAVGELALRIDHIGSTSVPGLASKDVIDIQMTVADEEGLADAASRLDGSGWRREANIVDDHRVPGLPSDASQWRKAFFDEPVGVRPIHLHVRMEGRANQRYALLFRDYLRAHPDAAAAYLQVKRGLASLSPDSGSYADAKDPACDLVYIAAEAWAREQHWTP